MQRRRPGRANSIFVAFLASVVVFIALVAVLALERGSDKKPLLVYCAVSLKAPVEAIAREYEKASGVHIELQFNASQTLLTNAVISRIGDLYLPADDSYIIVAREK